MKKPTRKCKLCGQLIDVVSKEEDFFGIPRAYKRKSGEIGTAKDYYHTQCYIDYHTKTKTRNKFTEEKCRELIKKYKADSEQSDKYEFTENQFHYFLMDMYTMNTLPKQFYLTLDAVYKGEYKKMRQGVPMEDLFDMWEKKKTFLIKTREKQKQYGNEISGIGALYYDLAVLIGKYDSYLEWKNKKIAEMGNEDNEESSTIAYTFVDPAKPRKNIKPKKEEIDIFEILNEI